MAWSWCGSELGEVSLWSYRDWNVLAKKVECKLILKKQRSPNSCHRIYCNHSPFAAVHWCNNSIGATSLPPTVAMTTVSDSFPTQSPAVSMERIAEVKAQIEKFEEEFSNLNSNTHIFLSDRENQDSKFLARFCDHLFDLPVFQRAVYGRFFDQNEDSIFKAENIEWIFTILRHYTNYSNYDITLHLVKRFCDAALKKRMIDYHDSYWNGHCHWYLLLCCFSSSRRWSVSPEWSWKSIRQALNVHYTRFDS